jgi:2-polyprenyl-3-methyl-5-hydroxy-6-metoxy-1,4-benzoquinol methylase
MPFLRKGTTLIETVAARVSQHPKGTVLDAGTGKGTLARSLGAAGFRVYACDILPERFGQPTEGVQFQEADLNAPLLYCDKTFNYVCCTEVIEHVENPFALLREFRRILKEGGLLFLSTPNVLNVSSRVRFLLEGAYEFFKYPVLEWARTGTGDLHLYPIRYHELEYYLAHSGFEIEEVFTSVLHYQRRLLFFPLELLMRVQMAIKNFRSSRPNEISTVRLYRILLSDELLYGEHLIVKGRKVQGTPGPFHPARTPLGLFRSSAV